MKILILTVGTRGDVQPFIALGVGLQNAGYDVVLCTSANFEKFVTDHGLKYAYMNDEMTKLTDTAQGKASLESGGAKGLGLIKVVKPMIARMFDEGWAAAQGADALIYHPKTLCGYHIAEKLNIPAFIGFSIPLYTPTGEFPVPLIPFNMGGMLNRMSYGIIRLLSAPYIDVINAWREKHGLAKRGRFAPETIRPDGTPTPVLYSYSSYLVPTPSDWTANAHATGFWFLEEGQNWQPPAALVDFLDKGAPPVYIGFGSMTSTDPEAKAKMVLEALQKSGQRGVLASGWGALKTGKLPDNVHVLESAPHDWLFPRMAAVVHHGGAGTTAAGLRAGKPTIICPFFGDQPFWGKRIHALGAGPAPIPQKKLTTDNLAEAIRTAVTDPSIKQRAAQLGEKLRAEDGVGNAIAVVNRVLKNERVRV